MPRRSPLNDTSASEVSAAKCLKSKREEFKRTVRYEHKLQNSLKSCLQPVRLVCGFMSYRCLIKCLISVTCWDVNQRDPHHLCSPKLKTVASDCSLMSDTLHCRLDNIKVQFSSFSFDAREEHLSLRRETTEPTTRIICNRPPAAPPPV